MPFSEDIRNDGFVPIIGASSEFLRTVKAAISRVSSQRLPVINAAYYGVKDKGPTNYDSGPALQAVINRAQSLKNGCRIQLPPGRIRIATPIDGVRLAATVISGAGARRSDASGWDAYVLGTTLECENEWALDLLSCLGVVIEHIGFIGDTTNNGIRIRSQTGAGSSDIFFRDCTFRDFVVGVGTGSQGASPSFVGNDSEIGFDHCHWFDCTEAFTSTHNQSLNFAFLHCNFNTCATIWNLENGGALSAVGCSCTDATTVLQIDNAGGSIGWNVILGMRVEGSSVFNPTSRTVLYNGINALGGRARTIFSGITIASGMADTGSARFTLKNGHHVVVLGLGGSSDLATNTSRLVHFEGSGDALFQGFFIEVNPSYLISTTSGSSAQYHFDYCNLGLTPWAAISSEPRFTGTRTFYAASTSGGSPTVLHTVTVESGLITAWTTTDPNGGQWDFSDAGNSGQYLTVGF